MKSITQLLFLYIWKIVFKLFFSYWRINVFELHISGFLSLWCVTLKMSLPTIIPSFFIEGGPPHFYTNNFYSTQKIELIFLVSQGISEEISCTRSSLNENEICGGNGIKNWTITIRAFLKHNFGLFYLCKPLTIISQLRVVYHYPYFMTCIVQGSEHSRLFCKQNLLLVNWEGA